VRLRPLKLLLRHRLSSSI